MRWFLVMLLALLLFNRLQDWLLKIGLGKLPGDFRFRFAGKDWFLPIASSLLLALVATLISSVL